MNLYIQNMVCQCCKMTVAAELKKMDLSYTNLDLGEVNLDNPITGEQRAEIKTNLHSFGLELMEDENAVLVEKVVAIIVKMIHESEDFPKVNFSVFLTNELNQDYHSLSTLFSKTKGITIEHFIILNKIERIKELITYDEMNLTEMSYALDYSSVQHLSHQFKKVTGYTPTFFKNSENRKRVPLESLSSSLLN
jgi:AraC-like DNA-binding protein